MKNKQRQGFDDKRSGHAERVFIAVAAYHDSHKRARTRRGIGNNASLVKLKGKVKDDNE